MSFEIGPEIILQAYRQGVFPMAENKDDLNFAFYRPYQRGQLSIPDLHIPRRLLKTIKQAPYKISVNKAFSQVIDGCAQTGMSRQNTWINQPIRAVFIELHRLGYAHSIECWQNERLAGGLYGLALGAVFCGESMFSNADDASKIALVHLCARLNKGGFTILDTQFTNEHLEQFGVYEISQKDYEEAIKKEMKKSANFLLEGHKQEEILKEYLSMRKTI